jgi:hypothetical protein
VLQLRESEITRLTGELVQEAVSFEELWSASEEKDACWRSISVNQEHLLFYGLNFILD